MCCPFDRQPSTAIGVGCDNRRKDQVVEQVNVKKELNGASTQSKPHLTPFLNIGKEIKKNKKDSYLIEDVV